MSKSSLFKQNKVSKVQAHKPVLPAQELPQLMHLHQLSSLLGPNHPQTQGQRQQRLVISEDAGA